MRFPFSKISEMFRGVLTARDSRGDLRQAGFEELPAEERQFLSIVKPIGIDWVTTRGEFEKRYGKTNFYDLKLSPVVSLPPTTALSEKPLQFHMNYMEKWSDLPPEYLFAHYKGEENARANFERAEVELVAKLGPGQRKNVSNCLRLLWRYGIFEISLCAWPAELKPEWMKFSNQEDLDVNHAASIFIKCDMPSIFPDNSLLWIADAIKGKALLPGREIFRIPTQYRTQPHVHDMRRTKRNPKALQSVVEEKEVVAWKSEVPGQIGVSYSQTSLQFDMKPEGALILSHLHEGRGSEGSEIAVQENLPADGTNAYETLRIILIDGKMFGLDSVAQELSQFWSLPIKVEETTAD